MSAFEPSPALVVHLHEGDYRLTQNPPHEDYSVWRGNKVIAQGGKYLMLSVFNERKKPMTVTSAGNLTPAPAIDIEKRVQQYIKLRNMIKEKDDAHKEAMAPYRDTLEKLNGVLLGHLNQIGAESVRSGAGTVYVTTKKSTSLEDADQFMRHVIGTESWDLLERKASQKAVEAFLDENGVLPPGVKYS